MHGNYMQLMLTGIVVGAFLWHFLVLKKIQAIFGGHIQFSILKLINSMYGISLAFIYSIKEFSILKLINSNAHIFFILITP